MYYQFSHARAAKAGNEKMLKLRRPEASATARRYSKALASSLTIYIFSFGERAGYRGNGRRFIIISDGYSCSVRLAIRFDPTAGIREGMKLHVTTFSVTGSRYAGRTLRER